jgi:hypothetical protein
MNTVDTSTAHCAYVHAKQAGACYCMGVVVARAGPAYMHTYICLHFDMSELRRSDRKRTATDFLGLAQAPPKSQAAEVSQPARRAREAALASAYEPLVGLVQLCEVGGEGRVWAGRLPPCSDPVVHSCAWNPTAATWTALPTPVRRVAMQLCRAAAVLS